MDPCEPADLDVSVTPPEGLSRLIRQNVVDLTPWHLMRREDAVDRLCGMRERYASKYVPFAYRQDSDDVACIDPERRTRCSWFTTSPQRDGSDESVSHRSGTGSARQSRTWCSSNDVLLLRSISSG